MTKKHFIALADWIKSENQRKATHSTTQSFMFDEEAINSLATFCGMQNVNFKADRWLDYIDGKCWKNGGKVKQALTK